MKNEMKLKIIIKTNSRIEVKNIENVNSYYFDKNYLLVYKNNKRDKQYFKLSTLIELEEI